VLGPPKKYPVAPPMHLCISIFEFERFLRSDWIVYSPKLLEILSL
jgi:hypothetical protein